MTSNSTADRESCSSEQRFAKPSMCVINFNGENYLENCLSAIQAERVDIEEILLVDNGSDDRSLDLVTRLFPWVRVVALDQNLGPAVARNIGVREASVRSGAPGRQRCDSRIGLCQGALRGTVISGPGRRGHAGRPLQ